MADGMSTPDLPTGVVTHILGNGLSEGVQDTVIESAEDFLARSVADGPIADEIARVDQRIDTVAAVAGAEVTTYESWALLAAHPPTKSGLTAYSTEPGDATHPDPVTGLAVSNRGWFRGSMAPLGWTRTRAIPEGDTAAVYANAPIVTAVADDAWTLTRNPVSQLFERTSALVMSRLQLLRGLLQAPVANALVNADQLVGLKADGSSPMRFTLETLLASLEEKLGARTYAQHVTAQISGASTIIAAGDAQRRDLSAVQCAEADIWINFDNRKAQPHNGDGNYFFPADGLGGEFGPAGSAALSAIAYKPGTTEPITGTLKASLTFTRAVDVAAPTRLAGDKAMVSWPDTVDVRFRNQLRESINILDAAGTWAKIKYLLVAGADAANNAYNLAAPDGAQTVFQPGTTGVTHLPYGYIKGGGVDARGATGITPVAMGQTADSHFLYVMPFDTTVDPNGYLMGFSGSLFVQPNRDANLAGFRSGSGTDVFAIAAGSPIALNRKAADTYDAWGNGVKVATFTRSIPVMPDRGLNILAINSAAGYANASVIPGQIFASGLGLTDAEVTSFFQQMAAIKAVMATIRAGG